MISDYSKLLKVIEETGVKVTGIVSRVDVYKAEDGDDNHTIVVSYLDPAGREYSTKLGYYSSFISVGKEIRIMVDKTD